MIYLKREAGYYRGTGLYFSPISEWYYNIQVGFVWKTEKKKTLWKFRINPKLRTIHTYKQSITREEYNKNLEYFPEATW